MQHAPDRGFSWVIVLCCGCINFALFGLFRSSGVIYVAMLQNYEATREEASWPFALCAAVFQLVGPLAGVLTHYISKRKACLLGCTIATLGVGGCYFADSVMWINVFYGLVHGLGFGIITTIVPVTINQYFVKYRATAMGIAFSGASVSTMIFPSVMEWLLENYTLKDSFLLLSGVVMNTLVAASLLREPPWLKKEANSKLLEVTEKLLEDGHGEKETKIHEAEPKHDTKCDPSGNEWNKKNIMCPLVEPTSNGGSSEKEQLDSENLRRSSYSIIDESQRNSSYAESPKEFINSTSFEKKIVKDDIYGGTALGKNELQVKEPLLLDEKKIVIVPKTNVELAEPAQRGNVCHSVRGILKEPMFYLITFTLCIYFLAVHSFFMVIIDFAKDKGIPEGKAVYIMTVFSITDLFGRAGLGWVTDRNYITRRMMLALNLGILGILNQLYPIVDSLSGILAVSAVHGLAVGSSITLFFVLEAECFGMDRLTMVMGLISFTNGIASLFRPGIIGLFRDVIGAYNWMFHFMGLACLVFSGMWLVEYYRNKQATDTRDQKQAKA